MYILFFLCPRTGGVKQDISDCPRDCTSAATGTSSAAADKLFRKGKISAVDHQSLVPPTKSSSSSSIKKDDPKRRVDIDDTKVPIDKNASRTVKRALKRQKKIK